MEQKLNIAEILKGKPVGLKFYSNTFGYIKFNGVYKDKIYFYSEDSNAHSVKPDGKMYDGGECIIFPSKEMRDWSKFTWKRGDVLVSNEIGTEVIFDKWYDDTYTKFYGKHYLDSENENNIRYHEEFVCTTEKYFLEDKDAAQTYINTIEERLGGKLNLQSLEIEKQPEFKDGDIVVYGKSVAICRKFYKHTLSFYVSLNEMFGLLFVDEVESSEEYRFATEEEKQQLFDALEKEGKAWDADKKVIVNLKPKWTPKPFDRVITRVDDDVVWTANIFSHVDQHGEYVTIGCVGGYPYCIPYNEETAKLLGTTDDWKG